jgi:branched-chain amino acid transport system ATP-binding protein
MTELVLDSISAGYGKVHILEDVSVSIADAETVVILGPNGSGKSTLIKTVMGLTTLYRGNILWDGRDLTAKPPYERAQAGLGYVPQTQNIFPGLTVTENMHIGAYGVAAPTARRELDHMFELFPNLAERRSIRAGNLSGGERRMLSLATTLMMKPRCLVLDEPTSDLSPAAIDVVFQKIREIRNELKLPILLVEQNVRGALSLADRICVLVRGQKILEKPTAESSEEELGELFLGAAKV